MQDKIGELGQRRKSQFVRNERSYIHMNICWVIIIEEERISKKIVIGH